MEEPGRIACNNTFWLKLLSIFKPCYQSVQFAGRAISKLELVLNAGERKLDACTSRTLNFFLPGFVVIDRRSVTLCNCAVPIDDTVAGGYCCCCP